MSRVPLSDEETRIIFSEEALEGLEESDPPKQKQIIRKLLDVVTSPAPPSAHAREKIKNLHIIAPGGQMRLYTCLVENIPRGNTRYHIINVLYIDESHDYASRDLATFNADAEMRAERIISLDKVEDVENYLEEMDAFGESALREMLD